MIEHDVKAFFSSYAEDFDSIYGDGKKRHIISRTIDKIYRKSMFNRYLNTLGFIKNNEIKSVLDIGCGSGVYLQQIGKLNAKITGIDLSDDMIKLSKKRLIKDNINYENLIVDSYLNYNFQEKFDLSILMGFFDYVEDPFQTIKKVLKDTNKFILGSFPKKQGFLYYQRKIRYNLKNCPIFFYKKNDIIELLQNLDLNNYIIDDNDREYFVKIYL